MITQQHQTAVTQLHIFYYRCGLLVLACSIGSIVAFQSYQNSIPNGGTVPNTCTVSAADTWPGVGHEALNGGGVRNPFGAAFGAAGVSSCSCHCLATYNCMGVYFPIGSIQNKM